jgi:hypothetical protein
MSTAVDSPITPELRQTLTGLVDVLFPAGGDMPGGLEVDAHGRWFDRVVKARPDLAPQLVQILEQAGGADPRSEVMRLQSEDRPGFSVLALSVAGAYYMSPKVKKRLGYPGPKADPPYPDESEYWLREGVLDPVKARGPIFRDAR